MTQEFGLSPLLTKTVSQIVGTVTDFPEIPDFKSTASDTIRQYLHGMRRVGVPGIFYCEWLEEQNPQERRIKKDIQKNFPNCCYNHRVGLPTIKFEHDDDDVAANVRSEQPIPLTGLNKRMIQHYHNHRRMSQNKCRGSGSSEILTVRWLTFKYAVLNTIYNHKAIVCAGTRLKSTLEFSKRAKQLLDKIPQVYQEIPTSDEPREFRFKTGGQILYYPASSSAIRGIENVGDIILEECAHWNLQDDVEVYRATEFVYTKTRCHILHLTTPRGKRGFYYDKVWDMEARTNYSRYLINWREVVGMPVRNVQELFDRPFDTPDQILAVRRQCKKDYETDNEYKAWFDNYFGGMSIQTILDVPNIILDVNHIIEQAQNNPNDYDQELDNQFIASENRAIGDFVEEDFDAVDLRAQLEKFEETDYE